MWLIFAGHIKYKSMVSGNNKATCKQWFKVFMYICKHILMVTTTGK